MDLRPDCLPHRRRIGAYATFLSLSPPLDVLPVTGCLDPSRVAKVRQRHRDHISAIRRRAWEHALPGRLVVSKHLEPQASYGWSARGRPACAPYTLTPAVVRSLLDIEAARAVVDHAPFPPAVALAAHPHHNYYEGREEADLTPWLEYFLQVLAAVFRAALQEALRAAEGFVAGPTRYRHLIGNSSAI